MDGQHRSHGGDRKGDALPRRNRFGGGGGEQKDRLCLISDLNSHFRVALSCSVFCRGVEFESNDETQFLVSLGEGLTKGELQKNVCW